MKGGSDATESALASPVSSSQSAKIQSPPSSAIVNNSSESKPHRNSEDPIAEIDDNDLSDFESENTNENVCFPKFGLSAADKSIYSFSCAIHARQGLGFVHGRMYLTNYFLAFQGWPDTRILIPLSSVCQIEKGNTLQIIPNAIRLRYDNEEYFFGSFANRGKCFSRLCLMVEEAKRQVGHGKEADAPWMKRDLQFGWQKDSVLAFGTGRRTSLWESNMGALGGHNNVGTSSATNDVSDNSSNGSGHNGSTNGNVHHSTGQSSKGRTPSIGHENDIVAPSAPADIGRKSSAGSLNGNMRPTIEGDEAPDNIVLAGLFDKVGISPLQTRKLPYTVDNIWSCMWKDENTYKEFLKSAGDKSVDCNKWSLIRNGNPIVEDVSKVPFLFSRTCCYSHPQKKNAFMSASDTKVTQHQYLYAWGRLSSLASATDYIKPKRFMVLTVSHFEGIPFCEYFRVLVYYCIDAVNPSAEDSPSNVRVGATVHFCKSTMLKSQIKQGAISDLGEFGNKYFAFLKAQLAANFTMNANTALAMEDSGKDEGDNSKFDGTLSDKIINGNGANSDMMFGISLKTLVFLLLIGYVILFVMIVFTWQENQELSQIINSLRTDKQDIDRDFQSRFEHLSNQLLQSQNGIEAQLKTQLDLLNRLYSAKE